MKFLNDYKIDKNMPVIEEKDESPTLIDQPKREEVSSISQTTTTPLLKLSLPSRLFIHIKHSVLGVLFVLFYLLALGVSIWFSIGFIGVFGYYLGTLWYIENKRVV